MRLKYEPASEPLHISNPKPQTLIRREGRYGEVDYVDRRELLLVQQEVGHKALGIVLL